MKKIFATILLAALAFNSFATMGYAEKISIDFQENTEVILGNPGKGYERYGDASVSTSDKVMADTKYPP